MKIGILLQRATDFKWAGPFAMEAIKAKHSIQLLAIRDEKASGKAYLNVKEEGATLLKQKGAYFNYIFSNEISRLHALYQIDFL